MENNQRQSLIGYSLFDFGNSAFTLIFHAYLFPLYLKDFVFFHHSNTEVIWGLLLSSSALSAAILGPIIGRIADHSGKWRVFALVACASFLTAIASAYSIGKSAALITACFFLASTFFYLAANLYDSLIGQVAEVSNRPAFSGFAWGFGYLGGVLCFIVVYKMQSIFGVSSFMPYLFTALFYTFFGILSLVILKKPIGVQPTPKKISVKEMLAALTKDRICLLIGYMLIADTIGAVISFTAIYASEELHLSTQAIGGFLLGVQLLAFPLTYLVCRAAVKHGEMKVLLFCGTVWIAILGLFVIHVNIYGMYLVTVLTALVIGSTQALMRSQYSQLVYSKREAEQFGWYGIATESAAVIAPVLFAGTFFLFGSLRFAMGLMLIPLVSGFFLLFKYTAMLATQSSRS
jgi:MFS transporter, UMF1 family